MKKKRQRNSINVINYNNQRTSETIKSSNDQRIPETIKASNDKRVPETIKAYNDCNNDKRKIEEIDFKLFIFILKL